MLKEGFPLLLAQRLGHQALPAGLGNRNGFGMKRGHDRVNPASTETQSAGASSYSKGMNNPPGLPCLREDPEPEKPSSSRQERAREEEEGRGWLRACAGAGGQDSRCWELLSPCLPGSGFYSHRCRRAVSAQGHRLQGAVKPG